MLGAVGELAAAVLVEDPKLPFCAAEGADRPVDEPATDRLNLGRYSTAKFCVGVSTATSLDFVRAASIWAFTIDVQSSGPTAGPPWPVNIVLVPIGRCSPPESGITK
jgi:hypothetical protein